MKSRAHVLISASLMAGCAIPQSATISADHQVEQRDFTNSQPYELMEIKSPPIDAGVENSVNTKNTPVGDSYSKPPTFSPSSVVPGRITVIFKDSYRIRNSSQREVSSPDRNASLAINALFRKFGLSSLSSGAMSATENEIDIEEAKAEAHFNKDIPHLKSILYLEFPEKSDTAAISKALRNLAWVRNAYPSPKVEPGATLVSRWTPSNMSGTKPADTYFSQGEETWWWWFNHHYWFQAWSTVSGVTRPPVVVVDNGFDVDSTTENANYDLTYAQTFDEWGIPITSNVRPSTSIDAWSHGTQMANIISSPSTSGSNTYLSGVMPGMPVIPLRAESSAAISEAIRWSYNNTNSWVTSVSMQFGGKPITWAADMRAACAYATGNGQTVVIIAGNNYQNLDLDDPNDDAGAIIVGGSEKDGLNWYDGASVGSSYGQAVHLTAAADVGCMSYNPLATPTRQWVTGSGTSNSAPQVAAAASLVRALYVSSRPTASIYTIHSAVKSILVHSANLAPTRYGEKLGKGLISGNAKMRELNVANAFNIAKRANGQPLIRVFNVDDVTYIAKNYDWNNRYGYITGQSDDWKSNDSIWDMRSDPFTTNSDTIAFSTYNFDGTMRSHGYQVWRDGILDGENIGGVVSGASERRKPWNTGLTFYGTAGEDYGQTDGNWHHTTSYYARTN